MSASTELSPGFVKAAEQALLTPEAGVAGVLAWQVGMVALSAALPGWGS